jgi:Outer membrane efflux protein
VEWTAPRKLLTPTTISLLLVAGLGCSRVVYRKKADRDAYAAIAGKSQSLPVDVPFRDAGIEPNPDSRFFDNSDPDQPPMPPDDPVSHALMLEVDGRKGAAAWKTMGDPSALQNEAWRKILPGEKDGKVALDLKSAVRLALINSRDFQHEKEDLYLSALDVSYQRYQLSPKFALSETAKAEADGANKGGVTNPPSDQKHLGILTDGSVRWITSSGGDLLASFANQFLWDFKSHSLTSSTGSLLNFTFLQPLLRLGGKDRALEALTQTERTLLANVRQMQQFQLGFYVKIATGRNSGEGPSRNDIVGASGLGVIAGTPGGRTGAPAAGGYLGLLSQTQQIENLEANVARLRQSLDQLSAAFDAGRIGSRLQVDQARLALFNSQSNLLSAKAAYQTQLDAYKVDMGLPPELPMSIRDPLLKRFSTTNPAATALDRSLTVLQTRLRDRAQVNAAPQLLELHAELAKLEQPFAQLVDGARADLGGLRRALPERKRRIDAISQSVVAAELGVEPSALSSAELENRATQYAKQLDGNATELQRLAERIQGFAEVLNSKEFEVARAELVDLAADFSGLLLAVSLNQTGIRLDTAELPAVEINSQQALATAKEHRLDWMNARARLVDSWRKVGFYANALKSGLDFTAAAGMGTINNSVAQFDGRTGFVRAGLRFDTPLSRLAERNNYREALIEYQRARRDYMLFEDRVGQSLRNTTRLIELCQLNFELRRSAVQVAISQVDIARLRLEEPPRPGVVAQIGATTARDLVTALSDLLDAQNDFLSMRVGYDVLRLELDFESGTMHLDNDGLWSDPGPMNPARLASRVTQWSTVSNTRPASSASTAHFNNRQEQPVVR